MSDPNINSAKKSDYKSDRDFRSGYSYGTNMNTVNMNPSNNVMPSNINKSTTKIANQPVSSYGSASSYSSYNSGRSTSSSSFDDNDKDKAIKVRNLIIGGLVLVILAIIGVYFFYIRPNNIVFPN